MIIKGLILFVVAMLCIVVVFASFIWALIRWSDKKSRDTGCLLSLLFLVLSILCSSYLVYNGMHFLKKKTPSIKEGVTNTLSECISSFPDTDFMNKLKKMQPKGKDIPNSFFTYPGVCDYFRMPLIYPYSLSAIDCLDNGYINNETGIKNIRLKNEPNNVIIEDIEAFIFNQTILLAKIQLSPTEKENFNYILLSFEKGTIEYFKEEETLLYKASLLGFDTTQPMTTVKEYYNSFFNN